MNKEIELLINIKLTHLRSVVKCKCDNEIDKQICSIIGILQASLCLESITSEEYNDIYKDALMIGYKGENNERQKY